MNYIDFFATHFVDICFLMIASQICILAIRYLILKRRINRKISEIQQDVEDLRLRQKKISQEDKKALQRIQELVENF